MQEKDVLKKITADKQVEVAYRKRVVPLEALEEQLSRRPKRVSFAEALLADGFHLIAEAKKASPSRGLLCPDFDPVALAGTYEKHGAAVISVLTESKYFQGSLEHLVAVKRAVDIPVLRKDFIFDDYQVYEAAAAGADAVLLIAAILEEEMIARLIDLSYHLGMSCLVETHDQKDVLKALGAGAQIIGINNRDLKTLRVDIETTHRLRPLITGERLVVSESGVHSAEDVKKMKEWGVDAILVGEALVTAGDIPAKMEELR
jgi:indole-3-glycerol phosphate synthase